MEGWVTGSRLTVFFEDGQHVLPEEARGLVQGEKAYADGCRRQSELGQAEDGTGGF